MYLAQLSDTHLQLGPLGTEPAVRLHHALGRVLALSPQPDCVLITGDLVQHGELAEY
ncbi:MAG: metallophosphoesterase [Jatrophihabitantaceae bacterium]